MVDKIRKQLRKYSSKEKAEILSRFFKTGRGQYGEGDIFAGIKVPDIRKVVKEYYAQMSTVDTLKFLRSDIHEERMFALLVLVSRYQKGNNDLKERIFNIFLKNTEYINNWDLVDVTVPHVVGDYLSDKDRRVLYDLARSSDLWKRRIAIVATFRFIKLGELNDTFAISRLLLDDKHDLIHKAVGWMLREAGKKDLCMLKSFLKENISVMPRTMLRYAIEKFPESERKNYLKGTV